MQLVKSKVGSVGIRDAHRRLVTDVIDAEVAGYGTDLATPVTRVLRGGKGLRPGLTIATAGQRRHHTPEARVLQAAAAVEVLHWATLVHDDVIDGATSRHGRVTVNSAEGLPQAIVTGDLLLSTVFALGERVSAASVRLLAQALSSLCIGQAAEERLRYESSASEDDVIAVLGGKTGSLMSTAAQLGAIAAGLPDDVVAALADFGMAFGISLQLLDDVLDLVSTVDLLGKPVLADFASGTMTVATVHALNRHPHMHDLVRPDLTPAELDRAVGLLRDEDSLRYGLRRAEEFAAQGEEVLLHALPAVVNVEHRSALRDVAGWPKAYLAEQLSSKVDRRWADALRIDVRPLAPRIRAAM